MQFPKVTSYPNSKNNRIHDIFRYRPERGTLPGSHASGRTGGLQKGAALDFDHPRLKIQWQLAAFFSKRLVLTFRRQTFEKSFWCSNIFITSSIGKTVGRSSDAPPRRQGTMPALQRAAGVLFESSKVSRKAEVHVAVSGARRRMK